MSSFSRKDISVVGIDRKRRRFERVGRTKVSTIRVDFNLRISGKRAQSHRSSVMIFRISMDFGTKLL